MTILEVINENIVNLSKDLVLMHQKIDDIHRALCAQREPNAGGSDEKVVSET